MGTVYIASKTHHAPKWLSLKSKGAPILSTWIHEAEPGATPNWPDLWERCLTEAAAADTLFLYQEAGEVLKGAWIELGAALSHNKRIVACVEDEFSILKAGRIYRAGTLESGLREAFYNGS